MAEPEETIPTLSNDALMVQILLQDLKPVRHTRHPLALIQRMGYLSDWTRERWDQAVIELPMSADLADHFRQTLAR